MTDSQYDLVAIGNALTDILAHAAEEFIVTESLRGMQKGAMTLIDADRAAELYAQLKQPVVSSGGSAGNTIAGFTSFGGKGAYIGKVADDEFGRAFRADLEKLGVTYNTAPLAGGAPTGQCMILVTPDAQRTMNTFLGAGLALNKDDVDPELIRNAQVTYLEGFLFDPEQAKEAFRHAAQIAHEAGRKVALSLSDPFCVGRYRAEFAQLVDGHVDIVFANEEELISLYETEDLDAAISQIRGKCELAVVTRGASGSLVVAGDDLVHCHPIRPDRVVDTTGAGDQYAAGFLYGYTRGMDLARCAHLGTLAATEVITHMGPRPEMRYSELLKKAAA
jgi:sugar/nucleoside kinase (ribokinase family)